MVSGDLLQRRGGAMRSSFEKGEGNKIPHKPVYMTGL